MCDTGLTRREAIARLTAGVAGAAALAACGAPPLGQSLAALAPMNPADTVEVMPGLWIHPRSAWGADLPPTAPIDPETVKFLLVHHTASSNNYVDPRTVIQSTFSFHTGPAKRWPDVAYEFFVARDGSVWEGRAGAIRGPVTASATGGNQGFAQLVCLIGNFVDQPPTEAAQASLVKVLKWLTWRYRLDTSPEATTSFVSRGSDKLPPGTNVVTPVISGHRDVTYTACPGDAAYRLLPAWRQQVHDLADPDYPQTGPFPQAERLGLVDP